MSYSSTPFFESVGSGSISITCAFHMFTLIVTCPRRVAHTFSLSCMRRQQTLGTSPFINTILYLKRLRLAKFFAMPPGKKAPPQQSSLTELWASKQKRQGNNAASTTATSGVHPRLEPEPEIHGAADAAGPTTSSEECAYCCSPVQDAKRKYSFTAATSKRKQETVTTFDSAYARVFYILHRVTRARVCIDFFASLVVVVRWLHVSRCRDDIDIDIDIA